jgi:hypothetical protein
MVTSPKGLGPEKDYAGEDQQYIPKIESAAAAENWIESSGGNSWQAVLYESR